EHGGHARPAVGAQRPQAGIRGGKGRAAEGAAGVGVGLHNVETGAVHAGRGQVRAGRGAGRLVVDQVLGRPGGVGQDGIEHGDVGGTGRIDRVVGQVVEGAAALGRGVGGQGRAVRRHVAVEV